MEEMPTKPLEAAGWDDDDEDCKPFKIDDSSEEDNKKINVPLGHLPKAKKAKATEDPEASNEELVKAKANDAKIKKLEEEIYNLRAGRNNHKRAVLVQHTKQAKKTEGESIDNYLSHVVKKGHGARTLLLDVLLKAVGKLAGEQAEELTKAMQEE